MYVQRNEIPKERRHHLVQMPREIIYITHYELWIWLIDLMPSNISVVVLHWLAAIHETFDYIF